MTDKLDAAKVNAVTAKLVGGLRKFDGPRWIDEGAIFVVIVDTFLPGAKSFDDIDVRGVHVTAHKTGWAVGVIWVGDEPVALEIVDEPS